MRAWAVFALPLYCVSLCFGATPKAIATAALTTIQAINPQNLAFETASDGTRFLALRLRCNDANAVRVHIAEMHLGAAQSLFLYSPGRESIYGPFEGAGPIQSGEFWSKPIRGAEVVLEFQAGSEPVADLPFRIDAIEAVDPAAVGETAIEDRSTGEAAIFEGDILISRPSAAKLTAKEAVAITGQLYRWPSGTMPYEIATNIPNQSRITGAIDHWNTVMAGTVRMIPRTTEANYVMFVYEKSAGTCNSYVGMTGYGSQSIGVGDYCGTGSMIHEIGHAWGLWHEHTREDRDIYVKINWKNINSSDSYNFTQNITNGDDIGQYDYASIMHYSSGAFSNNGLSTIDTIPAGIPIGQRLSLSTGDIAAIRQLYPAASVPLPVSFTVTSNPSGSGINADGVDYTTPATFAWASGSVHTITAVDSDSNGIRNTFANWSDGGLKSHTITASSSNTLLKADFAVAYSVKANTDATGSASIIPESADAFYAAGTALTLEALPVPGYCFASWTGLIAGTPNRANLAANRSYDLQAHFEPGSITLSTTAIRSTSAGGTYSIDVSANSVCTWAAHSAAPWVTVASPQSGSGSGTLKIAVAPNTTRTSRVAHVSVGGRTLLVRQAGDSNERTRITR